MLGAYKGLKRLWNNFKMSKSFVESLLGAYEGLKPDLSIPQFFSDYRDLLGELKRIFAKLSILPYQGLNLANRKRKEEGR